MDYRYHVVGRGKAGWHAKGINVSSSGGDLENGVYWTGAPTTGYRHQAVDGALIYDAKDADDAAFTRFVISGPMVDPSLDPEGVDRFGAEDRATAARMAPSLDGAFGVLAVMAQSDTFSGLDSVGVNVYRRLLRQVPGIKIGTIRAGGIIEWER